MKLKSYRLLFRIFSFLSDKTDGASFFVRYKLLLGTLILGLVSTTGKAQKNDTTYIPKRLTPPEGVTCYKVAVDRYIEVEGKVVDEEGEPVIGAAVTIKGTTSGVVADINGNFSLKARTSDILVFSLIGFMQKEVPVSKIKDSPIKLETDETEISCYIVIVADSKPHNSTVTQNVQQGSEIEIKGNLRDIRGERLTGVHVQIKDRRNISALTNLDGNFTLQAKPDDILVFSYIGYKTLEIRASYINANKPVVLEDDDTILCYDPVVIRQPFYKKHEVTKLSYNEVQTPPGSPVGDLDKFKEWIESNIKYNKKMLEDRVEGQLLLSFAVNKKGYIVEKKVISKLSPEADAEALRILSSSKRWKPGKQYDKAIKTVITITIDFKLPN